MHRFFPSGLLVAAAALSVLAGCVAPRSDSASLVECPTVPGEHVAANYVEGHGHTGISGQVLFRESKEPLSGAYVHIYPDTFSNLLGPSQFLSSPTDDQGRYRIELPPGTYYVVARKRMTGQPTGPLSPGDFYSEHQRIVTRVLADKYSVVDLPVVAMKAPMFFKREILRESDTGIQGRLLNSEGQPVPGGFAMAYSDPEMKRLPDFASTLSDAEGRFTLYLPAGGTFYLAARIHVWDMPQPGEPYGKFGGEPAQGVTVNQGSMVENIAIVLTPFDGVYKPGKSRRPY